MFWPLKFEGGKFTLRYCFNLAVEIYVLASQRHAADEVRQLEFQSRGRDLCFGLLIQADIAREVKLVSISRSRFMFWPHGPAVLAGDTIGGFQSRGRDLCFGLGYLNDHRHRTGRFQSRGRDLCFGLSAGHGYAINVKIVSISRSRFMFWPPRNHRPAIGKSQSFNLAVEIYVLASQCGRPTPAARHRFQSRGRDLCFGLAEQIHGERNDSQVSISRSRFMFWPQTQHRRVWLPFYCFNLAVEIYVLASQIRRVTANNLVYVSISRSRFMFWPRRTNSRREK